MFDFINKIGIIILNKNSFIAGDKMNELTVKAIFGSLLHDIGKPVQRAYSDNRKHSIIGKEFASKIIQDRDILNCIKYHHKSEINTNLLRTDSPAYIVYIADNIASGADRREKENENNKGFNKAVPLSSIFNLLNNNSLSRCHKMTVFENKINFPQEQVSITPSDYIKIVSDAKEALSGIEINKYYINSLLEILECFFSYVPSSTANNQIADISLFDHLKITAAAGSCISEYLLAEKISDFQNELFDCEKDFKEKKAFIMFSADFSGIQSFIYNIIAENALKNLRSRSFFLELLMEHIMDELLFECGVSRANLIYSGGGHSYVLLPNTEKTISIINGFCTKINEWLQTNFGIGLFMAYSYVECSANQLMNEPQNEAPYEKIFHSLNQNLLKQKMHKFNAEQIRAINKKGKSGTRECKICGKEDNLISNGDFCFWCDKLINISSTFLEKDLIIIVSNQNIPNLPSIKLPVLNGETNMYFTSESKAKELLANKIEIRRIYTKNKPFTGVSYSTKLYMGDYVFDKQFQKLIEESEWRKIAVLRADVDNLGQAFSSGFKRNGNDPKIICKYETLSRTAAFSRQISMFFRYYLNFILEGKEEQFELIKNSKKQGNNKKVIIVYSGGDDVFIIGYWKDVLEAAGSIQKSFERFVQNTLTISCGIGIFPLKYPLYKSAADTAMLEETSKNTKNKNSITLFSPNGEHTYTWDEFYSGVAGEKLALIQKFFNYDKSQQERGNSFLYKLLDFLRNNNNEKINIARYAYLLARLEPSEKSNELYAIYKEFSKKMYEWIKNPKDKKELITAIYIYVYLKRSDDL